MNTQIRDQFLAIAGTTGVFPSPHMTSPVVDNGGLTVIGGNQLALTIQGGNGAVPFAAVTVYKKTDGTSLWQVGSGASTGLAQSYAILDVLNSRTPLAIDNAGLVTLSSGLTVTTGGATVSAGNLAVTTGSLTIGAGSPALTLPGQSGAVSKTIAWADIGAGITAILGTGAGGVPTNNILRFDVSNGNVGGAQTALTLDGTGAAVIAAQLSVGGGGTVSASGAIRMATTSAIGWRNNGNTGDVVLGIDNANRLVFSGGIATTSTVGAAGGAASQPASPAAYIPWVYNGTIYKIPAHNP